jgi:hypothetical protein
VDSIQERPAFPECVDNTILTEFRTCPISCFRTYFSHWKNKNLSVHLHAGAAFARGLEVGRKLYFDEGLKEDDAMAGGFKALLEAYGDFECPSDSPKSRERMAQAFEYYLSGEWTFSRDTARPAQMPSGKHAIEFSFAEPLPIIHPTTGQPIIYAGRADMIVEMNKGLFVEDDKTASQLGAKWSNQWEVRSQFSGYTWAARQHGWKVDGVLVRGVAILKTEFKRAQHLTYRPAWEIDRWLHQTCKDVERMIAMWKSGDWDYNLGESCAAYGGCEYLRICKVPNPAEWMEAYFTRRKWDPLTRTETEVV